MHRYLPLAILFALSVAFVPALQAQQIQIKPIPGPDQTAPVILQELPQLPATLAEPLVISAKITDDVAVQEAVVYYRKRGRDGYLLTMMKHVTGELFAASFPGELAAGRGLEYYVEAKDRSGNIARRGAPETPLEAWYTRWWGCTIAGVVEAGAAAAAAAGGGGDDGGGPEPTGAADITAPMP
jgi:hypothetical protein